MDGQSKARLPPITLPRLMICEGAEDKSFFNAFIAARGLKPFTIWHTGSTRREQGGNSRFGAKLNALDVQHRELFGKLLVDILLIADCDDDPAGRFAYIQNQIDANLGHDYVPSAPRTRSNSIPRLSILMIPWDAQNGNLESLCEGPARSLSQGLSAHLDHYLHQAGVSGWQSQSMRDKAWIRANLSARVTTDPCITLSDLFESPQNYVSLVHNSLDPIRGFLDTF